MCSPIPSVDKTEPRLSPDSLRRFTLAVASLSDTEQNLYYLRYYQELPVKQLAHLYGLTPAAAHGRLRRIHTKLEQAYVLQLRG